MLTEANCNICGESLCTEEEPTALVIYHMEKAPRLVITKYDLANVDLPVATIHARIQHYVNLLHYGKLSPWSIN